MKVEAILGFAQGSGRLASGDKAVTYRLKRGMAHLVLVAEDAGDRTVRRFHRLCEEYGIPLVRWGTKEELGRLIGRRDRSVLAVLDRRFAQLMLEALPAQR